MLGIGEGELVLIVLFAFMIFGPDKLPGMGRTLGRALRQFRNAQEGFTEVVQTNIVDPAAEVISDNPKKPNRNRAAELEEDADLDLPEGEDAPRPKRTETFAERKKRLAAEKAAREAEAKEAADRAAAEQADAADADEDADLDADAEAVAPRPAAAQPKPAAAKPSAADLYSMKRPSRSEGAVAGEDGSAATLEVSDERGEERGAGEAAPAVDDAAPAGKPAGTGAVPSWLSAAKSTKKEA